jgi:hypothetical protein
LTQTALDNDAPTGMRTATSTAFGYAVWVVCVIAIGVSLRWRAVDGAMLADDWDHYAMFAGVYPVQRSPLDVFDFVSGSASERTALLEAGRLPWWSDPKLQLSVLRPLSSALSYFDFSVLGMARAPRASMLSLRWRISSR